jgi:hypothetical protein
MFNRKLKERVAQLETIVKNFAEMYANDIWQETEKLVDIASELLDYTSYSITLDKDGAVAVDVEYQVIYPYGICRQQLTTKAIRQQIIDKIGSIGLDKRMEKL